MVLRIRPLDEATRPALEKLLVHAWTQNWDAELARRLVHWRYKDRPEHDRTWLAFDADRCVAVLDSVVRPYLLDRRRILVRETCDWFCMPEYRPLGLGITLMRKMMACPEPLLSIGGSEATQALLPRLRWQALPDVQRYVLPIKARGLAGSLLRSRWPACETLANAIPAFLPLIPPRGASAPALRFGVARVSECQPEAVHSLPLPKGGGLVQLLEKLGGDWFTRMPSELARPLGLLFLLDEKPVGFSLSQLEPTVCGLDGCILHLQIAHEAQEVANWVIAGTARALADKGVGLVRCRASNPEKIAALRRAGFLARSPCPSYWWSKEGTPVPALIDAGYMRADDAIPFPALRGRHLGKEPKPLGLGHAVGMGGA